MPGIQPEQLQTRLKRFDFGVGVWRVVLRVRLLSQAVWVAGGGSVYGIVMVSGGGGQCWDLSWSVVEAGGGGGASVDGIVMVNSAG